MQLNLHVPKDRERLLGRLDAAARRLGKPKNQVVLDALERYLEAEIGGSDRGVGELRLPRLHLGDVRPWRRQDLYLDRED
ncbi:MAG: hypothetical protein E6J41_09615 [Chloroflexi bacterium]|nr:MAG: hypothetical protein E6J41_09615 [Chloroflexota bacterium]